MNRTNPILNIQKLGFQWPTSDPFLFCVHHLDRYPNGNGKFGPNASLSGRDIGQDFAGKDGWRMYHGEEIPGFPGHPHRGFETVTVVQQGYVDHADSLGAAGRYANGDVQWMTAGSGVQHSEMFPLLETEKENTLELFQIWLNLPARNKFVKPHFTMHWNEKIPVLDLKDSKGKTTRLKLVAGSYKSTGALPPPPDSWAANPDNQVWIWVLTLEPGAEFLLPGSDPNLNRSLYFFGGNELSIDGQKVPEYHMLKLKSDQEVQLKAGAQETKILILQGKPIAEPVVQYGPFVMNSPEEIQQAFADYRATQFGGWPWPSYDPVHTGEGRFARHADGLVEKPTA
jgi:redox-sensitive bicupin YhaK (pirin superfamily)